MRWLIWPVLCESGAGVLPLPTCSRHGPGATRYSGPSVTRTPVFNAALSIAFLGESAGSNTLVGGAIILAASLLPAALGEEARGDEGGDEDAKR